MKLRVLIADDELLARERLRDLLQDEPDVQIVAECANGVDAVESVRKTSPDLVFLDVQMPELNGLEVIRRLDLDRRPAVIFVTAHDQYTLRAFEAHAVDYLLKPFDRARFNKALLRAREIIRRNREHLELETVCELIATLKARRKAAQCLTVRSNGRLLLVKPSQIDWIRGADNYAELHVGSSVHLLRQTLTSLEHQLPEDHFIRISRSVIVNRDRIRELHSKSHGDYLVVLQDGTRLIAGRTYRAQLQRLLEKHS